MSADKRNNLIDLVKEGATAKNAAGTRIEQNGKFIINGDCDSCRVYYNRRADDWAHPYGPYMIDCPNCGRRVSRQARQCPGCGHPISWSLKKKRSSMP